MLDIHNTSLHAENDDYILMLLRRKLVELVFKVNPSLYWKYISKQGVPILYVKLTKALYSMLRSAMLIVQEAQGSFGGESVGSELI